MILEKIKSPGLAHLSYFLGDRGVAAVIDPRRDVDVYLDLAREEGLRITHILETHRNEDYVIGSLDLARRTGAEIFHGAQLPFEYGSPVVEGDEFRLGSLRLRALSTPGHTFESLSFVLYDETSALNEPVAVFTGDALFVGDVGRTDFFPSQAGEVAGLLYDSLFGKLLPLGDHVLLYPAHGAGSVCGSNLARREFSTLGYERRHNPALQVSGREEFIARKLAERHRQPPYFAHMELYNLRGAPALERLPEPAIVTPRELSDASAEGLLVIDARSVEAFGGAHLPGSLHLPLHRLSVFAGWFLPYDHPLALVVDEAAQIEEAARQLVRIGYDDITACLRGGVLRWAAEGLPYRSLPQIPAQELVRRINANEPLTLLDVRSPEEWEEGHLPGAINIYVGELPTRLEEVPATRPLVTFCGSGERASIAASVLLQQGFDGVENCLGSMSACEAAGCPIEHEGR